MSFLFCHLFHSCNIYDTSFEVKNSSKNLRTLIPIFFFDLWCHAQLFSCFYENLTFDVIATNSKHQITQLKNNNLTTLKLHFKRKTKVKPFLKLQKHVNDCCSCIYYTHSKHIKALKKKS